MPTKMRQRALCGEALRGEGVRLVLLATFALFGAAECWAHDSDRQGRDTHDTRDVRDSDSHGGGSSSGSGSSDHGGSGGGSSDGGSSGSGGSSNSGKGSGNDGNLSGGDSKQAGASRIDIERGTDGRERRRDEVLMVGRAEDIVSVRSAGFIVLTERPLASLNETIARIRLLPGQTMEQTVSQLQSIAPSASVAPNHIYRPSQVGTDSNPARFAGLAKEDGVGATLGIIDTGADAAWSTLSHAVVRTQAFAGTGYVPRAHGTVVAGIAAAAGARLAVADVMDADADNHLLAAADAIARAIDWLLIGQVPVINISIEGPDNVVLAHVIQRALAADVTLVAAAGNDGPAAEPAYPAAYPGVIAVTAVDEQGQVYRRANRGDYIAFSARGVNIASGYATATKNVSGTSFAAPVVAAEVARLRAAMPTQNMRADLIAALQREAHDLGPAGHDPVYGWGEIVAAHP